jgi:RNA recognition motif-containing protein
MSAVDSNEKSNSQAEHFKVIALNITERITKAHIEEIFGQYGSINYVDVVHGKTSSNLCLI